MTAIQITFDAKKLQKTFSEMEKAHKIASKNTLNIMAFVSRKNAQKIIGSEFTLRNNFTKRSIRVETAKENSQELQSSVGSTAKYMEIQEKGGTKKKASIGQYAVRGGNMNRLISQQYYLSAIKDKMIHGVGGRKGTAKSKYVARMFMAQKLNKFVRVKNRILRVDSFSSSRGKVNARTSIAYTIAKNVKVRGNQWLTRSIEKPIQDSGNIYQRELRKLWKVVK